LFATTSIIAAPRQEKLITTTTTNSPIPRSAQEKANRMQSSISANRCLSGAHASTSARATAAPALATTRRAAPAPPAAAAADGSNNNGYAPPPPPPPKLPPPPTLFQALSFSGPGPELVNARLAMVGLLAAVGAEAETGRGALQLLAAPPGAALALAALVAYASLAPILKGVRHEAFGPFSPRAEYWNGRAAMVGWLALLGLEAWQGGAPFF
jgi:hypothetical protein